jgi:hypothetical protein
VRDGARPSEDIEAVEYVGVRVDESATRPRSSVEAYLDVSDFVDFSATGTSASGDFRCADCGYGAVVHGELPPCPMCGGTVWESRGAIGPRRAVG